MKVLVGYASKHGSTKGIADFIGDKLRQSGNLVDVKEVKEIRNANDYDAFVIGSAVYMFHWLKEVKEFVSRNQAILSKKPVWLFSSGPVGKEARDKKGRDLRDVSGPNEIDELKELTKSRDHRVFFGVLDGTKLGFFYRQILKSSAVREGLPEGDFRDWADIEAWSSSIASSLEEIPKLAMG